MGALDAGMKEETVGVGVGGWVDGCGCGWVGGWVWVWVWVGGWMGVGVGVGGWVCASAHVTVALLHRGHVKSGTGEPPAFSLTSG